MYCPICKFHYDTKELLCPDCQTMLVDYKSDGNSAAVTPDNSWVIIAGIEDDINRELVKTLLDSNNIPSLFIDTGDKIDAKHVSSLINNTVSEIEQNIIMVPKEFRRDAIIVLRGLFGIELDFDLKEKQN